MVDTYFICIFAAEYNKMIMDKVAKIKKTKEEVIAAFRASIAKKKAWEEQALADFDRIRQERIQISY